MIARARITAAAIIIGAVLGALTGLRATMKTPGRHHVIFIVADAMRADAIGRTVNGREVTPNLNRLAKEGVRFANAFAASSWTPSSMASIITGQYPPYHKVEHGIATLPDVPEPNSTMPRFLSRRGYTTIGIVANPYVDGEIGPGGKTAPMNFGFNSGFDFYAGLYVSPESKTAGAAFQEGYARGEEVNARLAGVLDKSGRTATLDTRKPLYIYLHYMDCHQPYLGTAPRAGITGIFHSGGGDVAEIFLAAAIFREDERVVTKAFGLNGAAKEPLTAEEIATLRAVYYEGVRYADERVGELFDELRRRRMYENSTVIFTADHGDELAEHGAVGHAQNLYNASLCVPLIIKSPKLPKAAAGTVVEKRVSSVMIFPTVKEWFGAEHEGTICSLVPYLTDERLPHATILAGLFGRYKIITSAGREAIEGEDGAALFFDANEDLAEERPLPADDAVMAELRKEVARSRQLGEDVAARISTRLWRNPWAEEQNRAAEELVKAGKLTPEESVERRSLGDFLPEEARKALAEGDFKAIPLANRRNLSPEKERQLKALGYLN